MEGPRQASEPFGGMEITPRDILFECPACGKSLVVDETAEGLTIPCPQCHINVIVPPKQTSPSSAPPAPAKSTAPATSKKSEPESAESNTLHERLVALAGQLKELQTQRTEVTGRVASRVNEVNRDLILLARLETSQRQVLSELNQIVARLQASGENSAPTVLGASVSGATQSRVSFRP
jgi:uncharacterized Zn finger protein (UPF0148 family)